MNRYRLITKHINITFPKTSSILITQFLTLSLYIFSSSMSSIAHFPWLPLILWKLTLFLGLPCLFVLNVEVSQVLTLRSLLFFFFGILFQSQRLVCELPKWHSQDQLCLSFSFCKFVYSASQINLCKRNSWFSLSPQSAPPEALPISSDGNSVLLSVHMLEH